MANISLKNVPDDLYERLKQRASDNRRSINREIIHSLELVVNQNIGDAVGVMERAQESRERFQIAESARELAKIINKGRS